MTAAGRGITVPVFDFTVIIYGFITVSLFSSAVGGLLEQRFSALELRDVVAQQPIVLIIECGDVEGMNRHRRFLVEISFTINCDLIAIRGLLQRQSGHAEIDQLAFRQLIFTQPRARDHRRTLLRYLRKRAQRLQKNHLQTQKKRRDAFRRRSVFHICTSVDMERCG